MPIQLLPQKPFVYAYSQPPSPAPSQNVAVNDNSHYSN